MSPLGLVFLLVCCALVFALPRDRAAVPLLAACLHISYGQGVSIAGAYFTVIRLLIVVVLLRITAKGEWAGLTFTRIDRWMVGFAICLTLSSFFHREPSEALKFRLGLVFTSCGIFWAVRALVRTWEEVEAVLRALSFLLIPLAALMIYERVSQKNLYSIFGGVPLEAMVREGKVRSAGPFLHPILAGSAGATLLPLMAGIWPTDRKRCLVACGSCLVMVLMSASSGPLISLMAGIFALILWRWRRYLRKMVWGTFFSLIALHMVMKAPVWWLMARVDFTGSSTGYFRAQLIDAAIEHASEWVVAGTDTTRGWMATGVSWSEEQTDITNYFLDFGVLGGLPTMIAFIGVLASCFLQLRDNRAAEAAIIDAEHDESFVPWAIGCSVFAHMVTFLSVAYFDQTMVLWFATVGICACYSDRKPSEDSDFLDHTVEYDPSPKSTNFAV